MAGPQLPCRRSEASLIKDGSRLPVCVALRYLEFDEMRSHRLCSVSGSDRVELWPGHTRLFIVAEMLENFLHEAVVPDRPSKMRYSPALQLPHCRIDVMDSGGANFIDNGAKRLRPCARIGRKLAASLIPPLAPGLGDDLSSSDDL